MAVRIDVECKVAATGCRVARRPRKSHVSHVFRSHRGSGRRLRQPGVIRRAI